jgi:hypothetical protein
MGVILCPRHGRQGIAFVCPHVAEAVRTEHSLPTTLRASADLDFHEYKMNAWLCPECATLATSDGGGLERYGDEGLDWFFALKIEPVCPNCLADAGRGRPDPREEV